MKTPTVNTLAEQAFKTKETNPVENTYSPIESAIYLLKNEITHESDVIEDLIKRLSPVIISIETEETPKPDEDKIRMSLLEASLKDIMDIVTHNKRRLDLLIESLRI